ncbi:MAG: beta-ketoacyl-[acyl-carrier-protein] synthase family protein [Rhodospirillaceae bacterium]|nr:beta-ketoacyl-[acyl-carrier-protein] synthase family protein [Rhodospirillales bacterium]
MRRVVVTGIGIVSPVGVGLLQFWRGLHKGRCAIAHPPAPLDTIPGLVTAHIHDNSIVGDADLAPFPDRGTRFGFAAAAEAMRDAGLEGEAPSERLGVVLGHSASPTEQHDHIYYRLFAEGKNRTDPANVPRVMINALASHVARRYGARGPVLTIAGACASSAQAMGEALLMVRGGRLDAALVGGADAPLSIANCRSWLALNALAPDTCRPFSRDRKGTVLGEGACIMVIETEERARARGVRPYAEFRGYGIYADCDDLVRPSGVGAAAAMGAALADAGLPPGAIGYINAHGTGTCLNDATETAAIRQVFGAHAAALSISSTKSMHGHTLGAAGAIEAAAALLPLVAGIVPPTMNYLGADPACDLDYTPNRAVSRDVEAVLSNSFAFGGVNAALVFSRIAHGRSLPQSAADTSWT